MFKYFMIKCIKKESQRKNANGKDLVKRDKFVQESRTIRGAESLRRQTMEPSGERICLTFDRSKVNVLTQERRQNKW